MIIISSGLACPNVFPFYGNFSIISSNDHYTTFLIQCHVQLLPYPIPPDIITSIILHKSYTNLIIYFLASHSSRFLLASYLLYYMIFSFVSFFIHPQFSSVIAWRWGHLLSLSIFFSTHEYDNGVSDSCVCLASWCSTN